MEFHCEKCNKLKTSEELKLTCNKCLYCKEIDELKEQFQALHFVNNKAIEFINYLSDKDINLFTVEEDEACAEIIKEYEKYVDTFICRKQKVNSTGETIDES